MKLFTTTIIFAILIAAPVQAGRNNGYDSALNKAAYWGQDCYKTNPGENTSTYTALDANATKVIIKGGTTNKVYENAPFTDLTAQTNPRSGKPYGISHVIICTDTIDHNAPVEPDQTDDGGIVDSGGATHTKSQPQVAGADTVSAELETLPATGAPVVINLIAGTVLSTLAGLIARRRPE